MALGVPQAEISLGDNKPQDEVLRILGVKYTGRMTIARIHKAFIPTPWKANWRQIGDIVCAKKLGKGESDVRSITETFQ